jgi:hypothetical protein
MRISVDPHVVIRAGEGNRRYYPRKENFPGNKILVRWKDFKLVNDNGKITNPQGIRLCVRT